MKVLLVLNALDFDVAELEYPAMIAKQMNAHITAVFVENLVDVAIPLSKYAMLENYEISEKDEKEKRTVIERNIEEYVKACKNISLDGSFMRVSSDPLKKIVHASRYTDMIMIKSGLSFDVHVEENPAKFVEDILTETLCPVWVIPEDIQPVNEVIFTFNGSYSSMYAIKQFTHMFPAFKRKKVTVLSVVENDDDWVPHKKFIKEYMKCHYEFVEYKLLLGSAATVIFSHLMKQSNCVVTFGAYGRSKISQFFKKSKAEHILRKLNIPVFITHP